MDSTSSGVEAPVEGAVGGIYSKETTKGAESKGLKCEPCLFENAEVEATSFCMDCFEHLCSNCAREHRKNKVLRNHKLLNGEEVLDDLKALKRLKIMTACSNHPDVDVTYTCEDHDTFICATCYAERHRKCSQVNEISVITSGYEERFEIAKETLSQLQEYITSSKKSYEETKENLFNQQSAVLSEQRQLFDSIYEQLSQAKQQLELETDALVTKELNDLERNLHRYNDAELEKQEYQRLLDVTLKLENAGKLNVIPGLISRKMRSLRETLETEYRNEQTCLKFNRNVDLESFTNIGQVSVVRSKQVKHPDLNGEYNFSSDEVLDSENALNDMAKPVRENPSSQSCATKDLDTIQQQFKHTSLLGGEESQRVSKRENTSLSDGRESQRESNRENTSHSGKESHSASNRENVSAPRQLMKCSVAQNGIPYSVRCPDDKLPCDIYAIVILPDERLVMIDHNNLKLKVFEQDFSLAYTFAFMKGPTDMCHVQDQEVAVIFSGVDAIKVYHLGKTQASISKILPTQFEIVAMAKFGNDKKLAVLYTCQNFLYTTNFVKIIDTENSYTAEPFFLEKTPGVSFYLDDEDCTKMLFRGTNEMLLSGYWKFHCLEKVECRFGGPFEFSYTESWFYKSRKGQFLKDVGDLVTDEEGNIYACGSESNNIHQISAHDFRESRIIVNSIKTPLSISVNSKRGYLVVGCEDDDFMHVYHFT